MLEALRSCFIRTNDHQQWSPTDNESGANDFELKIFPIPVTGQARHDVLKFAPLCYI